MFGRIGDAIDDFFSGLSIWIVSLYERWFIGKPSSNHHAGDTYLRDLAKRANEEKLNSE